MERTNKFPYKLKQMIRYAHSKNYLISFSPPFIKENNFEILQFNNVISYTQKKEPVEGLFNLTAKLLIFPLPLQE